MTKTTWELQVETKQQRILCLQVNRQYLIAHLITDPSSQHLVQITMSLHPTIQPKSRPNRTYERTDNLGQSWYTFLEIGQQSVLNQLFTE